MEPTPAPTIAQFLPMIIIMMIFIPMIVYLIKKKGKSMLLIIPGIIPLVNSFVLFYLFSQTNKDVLDDIKSIKEKLGIE